MTTAVQQESRYAKCIQASKRVRWDIDQDLFRGRGLDFSRKFLPDGLTQIDAFPSLEAAERRLVSQIQGRTYANLFGLAERFIGAKIMEVSRDHWLGDQAAMEALVRFTDEELKHQELFRRLEVMMGEGMPPGYAFRPEANAVAQAVLGASTWAVLGLTCHIELFTQAHYRQSIEVDPELSDVWKDVFLFHWKEESQHAILDELEWLREDAKLAAPQRDLAVTDLIGLVGAVDALLRVQADADAEYFCGIAPNPHNADIPALKAAFLRAYRWQFIFSGMEHTRFVHIVDGLVTKPQLARIDTALRALH